MAPGLQRGPLRPEGKRRPQAYSKGLHDGPPGPYPAWSSSSPFRTAPQHQLLHRPDPQLALDGVDRVPHRHRPDLPLRRHPGEGRQDFSLPGSQSGCLRDISRLRGGSGNYGRFRSRLLPLPHPVADARLGEDVGGGCQRRRPACGGCS